jgi:hypothetical protein
MLPLVLLLPNPLASDASSKERLNDLSTFCVFLGGLAMQCCCFFFFTILCLLFPLLEETDGLATKSSFLEQSNEGKN